MFSRFSFRFCIALLVVCGLISGCNKAGQTRKDEPPRQAAYTLKRGAKFAWGDTKFIDEQRFNNDNIEKLLKTEIISGLVKKGLRYTELAADGEFLLSYMVELGDGNSDQKAAGLSGDNTAPLEQDSETDILEQGKLQIVLTDAETGRLVWQNYVAGFTSTEMPDDERKQRLLKIIEILLDEFPETTR